MIMSLTEQRSDRETHYGNVGSGKSTQSFEAWSRFTVSIHCTAIRCTVDWNFLVSCLLVHMNLICFFCFVFPLHRYKVSAVIDHNFWNRRSWLVRNWRPKAAFPNPEISKIIGGPSSCSHSSSDWTGVLSEPCKQRRYLHCLRAVPWPQSWQSKLGELPQARKAVRQSHVSRTNGAQELVCVEWCWLED